MKLDLPGLLKEKLPSGHNRYRVRVANQGDRRLALTVTPDHPEFLEIYRAARRGIKLDAKAKPVNKTIRHSVAWLTHAYLDHLEAMVKAGKASPATLKQRKYYLKELREFRSTSENSAGDLYADMDMNIPQEELIAFRDNHAATSGKADNMIKSIRSMYRWAVERKICKVNPAVGIGRIHTNQGGATPWTMDNLKKFRATHPPGTKAHLALSVFMFTACRVSDAIVLGRSNEFDREGVTWLGWDPKKKNTKRVEIPMLPPLMAATRAQTIVGPTYLLSEHGRPFKTVDSFRNRFKRWCVSAGLPDRSPHGIRKAAGHLLAEHGATQYQIMTIHGHTDAATSEIYTKGVERQRLAQEAMQLLSGMEW